MAQRTNFLQLALDLRRGSWLIKDADILMPAVNRFFARDASFTPIDKELQLSSVYMSGGSGSLSKGTPENKEEQTVIIAPLHGPMTKYETCESYGTTDIAERIMELADQPEVVGFVLDIDSCGGASNAIAPIVRAIEKVKAAGKPIIAHCDACYSAAYWVASQCDAIFADNDFSGFGSIGAYAQFLDDREDKQTGFKAITVYAPESEDKNKPVRDALDGKPEAMQKDLSLLVSYFHSAVKAGRHNLKTDAAGVMSGADFYAKDAIDLGLADGMATLDECANNVFIRAEYK